MNNISARDHVVFSLLRTAHTLESKMEETLASLGLSVAKLGVLTELVNNGALPLSQLAARQSCVRSNMTQLVDRLEADGLVRRVDDPADRRSVLAELTSLGRAKQTEGTAKVAWVQGEFLANLSDSDGASLNQLLSGLR
jgi:DNA-binding MarR family transcriptional regulator